MMPKRLCLHRKATFRVEPGVRDQSAGERPRAALTTQHPWAALSAGKFQHITRRLSIYTAAAAGKRRTGSHTKHFSFSREKRCRETGDSR